MKEIPEKWVKAGYTGVFQMERPILEEDFDYWTELIGNCVNLRLPVRHGKRTASWFYLRDVIETGLGSRVVIIRRDIDAVFDIYGISVGQLGG